MTATNMCSNLGSKWCSKLTGEMFITLIAILIPLINYDLASLSWYAL